MVIIRGRPCRASCPQVAVEGCCHGDLDKIYGTMQRLEQMSGQTIDLLICCGDFQARSVHMPRLLTTCPGVRAACCPAGGAQRGRPGVPRLPPQVPRAQDVPQVLHRRCCRALPHALQCALPRCAAPPAPPRAGRPSACCAPQSAATMRPPTTCGSCTTAAGRRRGYTTWATRAW